MKLHVHLFLKTDTGPCCDVMGRGSVNDCAVYCPRTPNATRKEHVASNCVILLFVNKSRTPYPVICMFRHVRRVCISGVLYLKGDNVNPIGSNWEVWQPKINLKPFTEHEISFLNFCSAIEREFRSLVIFLVLFELRRSAPQETGDYLVL